MSAEPTASAPALLIVAESGRDPDLARFVSPAHLGKCFLFWPVGGEPHLGFFTAMEREEASSTGLPVLGPPDLGVGERVGESRGEAAILATAISEAARKLSVEPGPLALAGRIASGTLVAACELLAADGWSFVDGRARVLAQRRKKTPREVASACRAAAAVCAAFRRLAAALAESSGAAEDLSLEGKPLTVGRLRRLISTCFAEHQVEQPEGNIVALGRDAGIPHSQGSSEIVLRRGSSLIVDLFPRDEIFADCTRTFCVGEAPPRLRDAHRAVLDALELAQRKIRVGVTGWELQQEVCGLFERAGHATPLSHPGTDSGYVHGLGHGVGYEVHEQPSFRKGAGVLEENDLVTLEPGLYYPDAAPGGGFGVRLEDLVLLERGGPRNLTPLPYDLDPRAWQ